MKGQFMLISSIVIGLILMSTAATVSDIQSRSPNVDSIAHDINYIESEVQQTDLSDPNERDNLKEMLNSDSDYNTKINYWESQNCLNLTLKDRKNQYKVNCIGNRTGAILWDKLFELNTIFDFNNKGSYSKLSAERADMSGNLGIGYRNATAILIDDSWKTDGGTGFIDITSSANLGSSPGGGVILFPDLNGDGYLDVFMNDKENSNTDKRIRENNQDNTFTDRDSAFSLTEGGRGASIADFDEDGDIDLIVGFDANLIENQGSFNFDKSNLPENNREAVMWADVDGDGDLDIWAPAGSESGNPGYYWFENSGGSFTGRESMPGTSVSNPGNTEGATSADINNDGYPDFIYTEYSSDPSVTRAFINNGDYTYTYYSDISSGPFGDFPTDVEKHENMEWAWGDYNNDGAVDVFISGADGEGLYQNDGSGSFTEVTSSAFNDGGEPDPDGAAWGDYNNDGNLDLLVSQCGSYNSDTASCGGGESKLYVNQGDGTFLNKASTEGIDSDRDIGKTVGFFDSDNDGDLDIISNDPVRLWENQENDDNYLRIYVEGNTSKAGGSPKTPIGAQIYVENKKGELVASREITGSYNQLQPPLRQHIGLDNEALYSINIWYPSSNTWTNHTGVKPNEETVTKGGNTLQNTIKIVESETDSNIPHNPLPSVSDNLVGFWRFDRSSGYFLDYSGHKNNGSNNGAVRGVQGIFSTNSVAFPDDNDVIQVPHDDSLAGMNELTISAWIKEEGDPGTNYAHIVSKSAESVGSGDSDYALVQQDSRDMAFRVNTDGNYDDDAAVGNPPTRGEWMHVVGTWDGSEIKLYQDGALIDTKPASGTLNDANDPLGLGRHAENTDNRYFDGSLDEVRIYKRALTSSEVKRLYFHGDSGEFRGNYTSDNNNIDAAFNVSKLQVNSDIVSGTNSSVEVKHSKGGQHKLYLDSGDNNKNYSLPFSNKGGDIDITVNMNSTNEENSPIIRELKVWGMN